MRKALILIALAIATSTVPAQEMYSFMYQEKPGHLFNMCNLMQQRDGDFVVNNYILEDMGSGIGTFLGYMFYKISPTTLTITDSLFVADTTPQQCLFARDPLGEGNIRAFMEYQEDCDSTFLHIQHFADSDLHAIPNEDVLTPICEGVTSGMDRCTLIDNRGDLIIEYFKERPNEIYDEYIARIGPDGTLKHQALLQENTDGNVSPLMVLKESPLQYYQFRRTDNQQHSNLSIIVIDSLFRKNTVIINRMLRTEIINPYATEYEYLRFENPSSVHVVPVGGNDILVAAPYVHDTNFDPLQSKKGVAVAKYDLRTMQMKGYVVFDVNQSTTQCMALKMMTDGTIYLAYKKNLSNPDINIVKMDAEMCVEWDCFCKTRDVVMLGEWGCSTMFEDGQGNEKGIAWSWIAFKTSNNTRLGLAHFLLNHDGIPASVENEMEVRPYAFYPNPANDYLRLQYSPDVEPRQIELYDLQGRLVRSQGSGLESLNLQGLAPGQYVMKVTLTDGTTFSDKVVKE